MQIVLNIVGKDFLRLRWALLGAWAVTAATPSVGVWSGFTRDYMEIAGRRRGNGDGC